MGLIKAGLGALGGVLGDQWKEFFYCESLLPEVLVAKGQKRLSSQKRSSNTSAEDNIISNGSVIAVNEGQCMIIVEQGKVVDICAVPGEYIYEKGTEPSLFSGDLKANIKGVFSNIGKRFTFGADPGKDQRVYYVNIKEIMGNKYGTPSAIPFRVVDKNVGMDIDISLRCFGEYSYRLTNPILFYTNVCGNVDDVYERSVIEGQLKTELLTALQPAFAKISEIGIRYSAIPGHTEELAKILNEELSQKWGDLRGIEIVSFGISSIKASEEDEALIKSLQRNTALSNPRMAAAHLVGAQASAMQTAAGNSAGAATQLMGVGMVSAMGGGVNAGTLFALGSEEKEASFGDWNCSCGQRGNQGNFCSSCGRKKPQVPSGNWDCMCGAKGNQGNFCTSCGAKKPEAGWVCSCQTVNQGNFCSACGLPKVASFKCDKCGWMPIDSANPPKFCPECGDIFDENDKS